MDRSDLATVLLTAAQYAIAVAALAWVVSGLGVGEVAAVLGRLEARTVLALVAVTVLGLVGRFYTWYVLVAAVGPASLRTAAATDLAVNFVNQLLPSRLTGRLAAPFVLRAKAGMAYADAAAVAGVHTGIYAVLYGATAAVGLALAMGRLSLGIVALLALSTALYLAAGAVVLLAGWNLSLLDGLVGWLERAAGVVPYVGESLAARADGLVEFTADSSAGFRTLTAAPGVWIRYAAGWALALVVAPGVRVWLLLGAFDATVAPIALLALYVVAAYSVTLLPLTPGGIGITEATASVVFVALGVPGAVAVSVVLIDRFLGVYLPALAGWYPAASLDRSSLAASEPEGGD